MVSRWAWHRSGAINKDYGPGPKENGIGQGKQRRTGQVLRPRHAARVARANRRWRHLLAATHRRRAEAGRGPQRPAVNGAGVRRRASNRSWNTPWYRKPSRIRAPGIGVRVSSGAALPARARGHRRRRRPFTRHSSGAQRGRHRFGRCGTRRAGVSPGFTHKPGGSLIDDRAGRSPIEAVGDERYDRRSSGVLRRAR